MLDRLRTPDAPTGSAEYKQILLTIPTHVDLERFLWGALFSTAFWTSWLLEGSLSVEDTTQLIKEVLMSRKEFDMLGVIVSVTRETLHSSMLLCDGSVYNKTDYPQLWEVLPSTMKDATTLTLPDLRNLFLVGAGLDYSLSDTGGEADVTLTIAEMPSHSHTNFPHSHTEISVLPSLADFGTGVPVPSATPSVAVTGASSVVIDNTGGDQAHENRPPYYAVVYAMIAKVIA